METQAPTPRPGAVLNENPRTQCREADAARSVLGHSKFVRCATRNLTGSFSGISGLVDAFVAAALMLQ
jgi:hypothetical protein